MTCQAVVRIAPLWGTNYSAKLHRCTRRATMRDWDGRVYCTQHAKAHGADPKSLPGGKP